jgi:hypothetical protein
MFFSCEGLSASWSIAPNSAERAAIASNAVLATPLPVRTERTGELGAQRGSESNGRSSEIPPSISSL